MGTYHTESKHTTRAIGHSLLAVLVVLVRLQTRVEHPADARVGLEPFSERLGVLDVLLAAEGESLETLEEEPGVEGTHTWAQVTHGVHAEFGCEGFVAVCLPEAHTVVSRTEVSG